MPDIFNPQTLMQEVVMRGNQIPTTQAREKNPLTVLTEVFGNENFRQGQEEGADVVLTNNDADIFIPTRRGKIVIYTILTLLLPGLAVVISPLLMFMHDQVLRLREKAINTCYINSLSSETEKEMVIANLLHPDTEYKVLLTSSEIVASESVKKILSKLKCKNRLNFFAIDEVLIPERLILNFTTKT